MALFPYSEWGNEGLEVFIKHLLRKYYCTSLNGAIGHAELSNMRPVVHGDV